MLASPSGKGPEVVRKLRSRKKWLGLVLALTIVLSTISVEFFSNYAYRQTLAAFRSAVQGGWSLGEDEVQAMTAGWPTVSDYEEGKVRRREYRWPSLVQDLRIQFTSDEAHRIVGASFGRDRTAIPAATGTAEGPLKVEVVGPSPEVFGVAADRPAVFAIEHRARLEPDGAAERGRLARELIRQALLISARDEFGLPTRDNVLGEVLPEDEHATLPRFLTNIQINADRKISIEIEVPARDGSAKLFADLTFELGSGPFLELLASKAEKLSVEEFSTKLEEKLGLIKKETSDKESGALEEDLLLDLERFEILSQYSAVRKLHAEIRDSGESVERLGALVRGYAHLAALCQYLWSPAQKVFAARSLLYAERLLRRSKQSGFARWHRGYARALTGLHSSALDDFAKARADSPQESPPDWAEIVEPFCRGDFFLSAGTSRSRSTAALPTFLGLLANGHSTIESIRLEAATRMLKVEPACELAYCVALDRASLGVHRQLSEKFSSQIASELKQFLKSVADLPDDVRRAASTPAQNLKTEFESRAAIIAALRESDRQDREAVEPSWGMLAHLIQEVSLVEACALLEVEKFMLGVDSSETLAAVRPVFKGHRYEVFADVFSWDPQATVIAVRKIRDALNPNELDLSASYLLEILSRYWRGAVKESVITPLGERVLRHSDRTFGDLARALSVRGYVETKQEFARALREVSPGSSLGIASSIKHDWERSESLAGQWEEIYGQDLEILGALAEQYTLLKRLPDAVRCRKRQLELRPEPDVYDALAALYKEQGEDRLWYQTLTELLQAPAHGLEHSNAHAELACYHMDREEWDEARPHALEAAASYSGTGLGCAARYFEGTEDWNRANQILRMMAERYTDAGSAMNWYYWCRATGHGDLDAARKLSLTTVERLRNSPFDNDRLSLAVFYVLEGQPEQALVQFREASRIDDDDPFPEIHAALIADELGRDEERNQHLQTAWLRAAKQGDHLAELISALQASLASDSPSPNLNRFEWLIRRGAFKGSATNEWYFVGRFLALRGLESEAREYLRRAATSSESYKLNCRMAGFFLRNSGIDPGRRRVSEFTSLEINRLDRLKKANTLRSEKKWDEAITSYGEILAADPDFLDALYERGVAYRSQGSYALAVGDFTRSLELAAGVPEFLVDRGTTLEYLGKYSEAIDDYEAALRSDPRTERAQYNLAFLRASCPDENFRNGGEARERALIVESMPGVPIDLKLTVLAAACAETGAFDEAIKHQVQASQSAPLQRRQAAQKRLELYRQRKPYHREPEWWR